MSERHPFALPKDPLPKRAATRDGKSPFEMGKFLVPGWKGESLFSKPANLIKKTQEKLWCDALSQFHNLPNRLNPSLRGAIYKEYLFFLKNLSAPPISQEEFWKHFYQTNSPLKKNLSEFIEIYAFKVATVYLYKLMFIVTLADNLSLSLQKNDLMLPHAILRKLFKKGSSHELECESLRQNQYSWYHPGPALAPIVETFGKNFKHLGIGQLMKLSTYRELEKTGQHFDFSNQKYSHALSHSAFGLFLDHLLIQLPRWFEKENFSKPLLKNGAFPK